MTRGWPGTSLGSPPRGELGSPWRWLFLAAALAPVLVLTLAPSGDESVLSSFLICVICGAHGSASLVRNGVLFVPLGVALALLLGPGRWALLAVASVTATIEALQFHVPGRNPLMVDLVSNFTGGAMSVALVRWAPFWARPSRLRAAVLSLTFALFGALTFATTAHLFAPELPRSTYWGQWTPVHGHLARYEGRVLAADAAGVQMPSWRLDDSDVVRHALMAGGPVTVEVEVGPPPPGLAPILSIYDGQQREVLLLGADGQDLVGRIRFRANRFRFDRPDLRVRGAFGALVPGDTASVAYWTGGGDSCLAVDGHRECGLGPRLERGWALLLYPRAAPGWLHRLLDFGWMLGLALPFGFFARRHLLSFVGGGLFAGATAGGWWMASVAPPSVLGWFGAGLGLLAGVFLARAARTGGDSGVGSPQRIGAPVPQ